MAIKNFNSYNAKTRKYVAMEYVTCFIGYMSLDYTLP